MNIFDTTILEKYLDVINIAAKQCVSSEDEEEGGVIVYKDEEFMFIKIDNKHKGTITSKTLYEVNPAEFGELITNYVSKGWKLFSSFHTHPSFPPTPSTIDIQYLFPGYKYNTIYSKLNNNFNINICLDGQFVSFITRKKHEH